MGTVGWLLLVAIAIALGYGIGRLWPGSAAKVTELERERDLAREELSNYRTEVSQHFEHTAELFDKVTADYRGLYEHLAVGARQLGAIRGEAVGARLVEPEQRRLAAVSPGDDATPTKYPDVAADESPPPRPPRDYDESPDPGFNPQFGPEPEPALEAEPDLEPDEPDGETRGARTRADETEQEDPAKSAGNDNPDEPRTPLPGR